MSSYGMDHEEFTKATGLREGDEVDFTLPDEKVKRAVIKFDWVGAGFCIVNILYDSDKPGFPDGSKYVSNRKRYSHSWSAHWEINHPAHHPFNGLSYEHSEGIIIKANGKTYTRKKLTELVRLDEIERVKESLRNLPKQEKMLKEQLKDLES